MRVTLFANDRKTMRERLYEKTIDGWKQVGKVHFINGKYQVKVEKERN